MEQWSKFYNDEGRLIKNENEIRDLIYYSVSIIYNFKIIFIKIKLILFYNKFFFLLLQIIIINYRVLKMTLEWMHGSMHKIIFIFIYNI